MSSWKLTIALICLIGTGAFGAGYAVASQPHMQAALVALEKAHSELKVATADKHGHRVKALTLVYEAIKEVRAGMAYSGR